ncbi:protein broad-minded-like, partial [Micropterus dolomieu]|uniref:protein broad-minded-like n=1 Tax=Micropterus dolomieu TaxID=147949 RepID=UPI001E8CDEF3
SFLSLVNLLSSSQSVWELLGRQPLANKSEYTLREMPTSIADLIDRLIAVNSDAKINSLFHYEQSHTFGLSQPTPINIQKPSERNKMLYSFATQSDGLTDKLTLCASLWIAKCSI